MYDDSVRAKGELVDRLILDLPQKLIAELHKRAAKNGQSIEDFIREELELRYLRPLPHRKRGDISNRPEVKEAIRVQDEMRERMEGSGYSGSEFIRRMRDGGYK